MSGHSKWSTIKRKKEVQDVKKGHVFTKMAKLIAIAAREGGMSDTNFKLRLAIDEARKYNVPQENIKRAIQKGSRSEEGNKLEQVSYEAYGPSGIAFIIEAVTDNKNRTAPELRKILADFQGRLVENGSVSWMFERKAIVKILISENRPFTVDDLILKAIDCEAMDVLQKNGKLLVFAKANDLRKIKDCLEKAKLKIDSAKVELKAKNLIKMDDKETLMKIENLIESLKENDDVVEVYTNL